MAGSQNPKGEDVKVVLYGRWMKGAGSGDGPGPGGDAGGVQHLET